jgi:hypothetical protein
LTFENFRRLCLALPEAEERETWGEATFRVRDRIFAMGSPQARIVSIKASLDDQAGLIAMDPRTFAASAYTGRYGWVSVRLAGVGMEIAQRLVRNAWERTAPRRLVAEYGVAKTPSLSKPFAGNPPLRRDGRREAGAPRR